MICEYSSTVRCRPSSTISMLMKSATDPSIVGAAPSAGSLNGFPLAPSSPASTAVTSSSSDARLVLNPEQLRVDVRILLARLGVRRVHVRGNPVTNDPVIDHRPEGP